ncbi:hypothetical protein BHM03_00061102, partial [Ensete ventricosum]
NLDLLEELRAEAHLSIFAYQKVVARLYNRRVRLQRVGDGNLVPRKAEVTQIRSHVTLYSPQLP